MERPDYFLADLPAHAELSPEMVTTACQTLRRNRERFLRDRTTEQLVRLLAGLAENWRSDDFPFRKQLLAEGPAHTGFSEAVLRTGADGFFRQLTEKNLNALLVQELGNARRLDEFAAAEGAGPHRALAHGPELLVHIAAGNVPNPTWMSLVLGVLVRSAQFVKCARGASWLPRLFAHSLYAAEPKLGACLEIAEWKGGTLLLEDALFAEADCVTATGSDETLAQIRRRLPERVRFLGYGHRVSFGFVAKEILTGEEATQAATDAATDVAAWNQLGCLSPHVFYVERGGKVTPEQFAEMLAKALEQRERTHPRGTLPPEEAGHIAYRRSFYEVRAAGTPETKLWQSHDSTAWTVIYDGDALFQFSCLNRFVHVKAVENLRQVLEGADAIRNQVSTVGLAAPPAQAKAAALELARWGATRVCPLGHMQNPPLTWRHDGRPPLGDLLRWTDGEF